MAGSKPGPSKPKSGTKLTPTARALAKTKAKGEASDDALTKASDRARKRRAKDADEAQSAGDEDPEDATQPNDPDQPNDPEQPNDPDQADDAAHADSEADEAPVSGRKARNKGRAKASEKTPMTFNGTYTLSNDVHTKAAASAFENDKHSMWHDGTVMPRMEWFTDHFFAPPTEKRDYTTHFKDCQGVSLNVQGSSLKCMWNASNLNTSLVEPYLGFQSALALNTWVLSEGKWPAQLPQFQLG